MGFHGGRSTRILRKQPGHNAQAPVDFFSSTCTQSIRKGASFPSSMLEQSSVDCFSSKCIVYIIHTTLTTHERTTPSTLAFTCATAHRVAPHTCTEMLKRPIDNGSVRGCVYFFVRFCYENDDRLPCGSGWGNYKKPLTYHAG